MKYRLSRMRAAWLAGCVAVATAAAGDGEAEELMRRVRMSMPDVPLEMEAAIRVIDRTGRPLRTVRAQAHLAPRADGRVARYTLLDGFGGVMQEMTVELGGATADFSFAEGDPPQPAPLPDLFGSVAETGISWMELSFSFFWWPNPRIVGSERVANRWDCRIIEMDCPPELASAAEGNWSRIRLWVAPAYGAVVRGEAWRGGGAVKRFEVQSVKKLRQVYMIGDMEVRDLVAGRRAKLKVGRMQMVSPEYTPEELEELNAPIEW